MITRVIQTIVFVKNLQEAKKFYTEKLGFTIVTELHFSADWSYLTVAPQAGNETVIELHEAKNEEQLAMIGKQGGNMPLIMLASDNIEKDYQDLKAKGVIFKSEPKVVPKGKGVNFEDLDGNRYDLYQYEG